jgi:choice-of-anchor A domain-containing protein
MPLKQSIKSPVTNLNLNPLRPLVAGLIGLGAISTMALPAQAQSLSGASAYNLYTTNGNVTLSGSDSLGAIAANGSISGSNYYAVNDTSSTLTTALAAAGNITGSFSCYGNAYAEGSITNSMTYYNGGSAHANTAAASMPLNFSSTDTYLQNANSAIYQQGGAAPTGYYGTLTFTATHSGANYFQIDAATLCGAAGYGTGNQVVSSISFLTNGNSNVSFLVNITNVYTGGTNSNQVFNGNISTSVNGGSNLAGINQVLYNLNPSIVGFSANGVQGSVLAPNAAFNGAGSAGQIDGNFVVKSYDQGTGAVPIELHNSVNSGNSTYYTGFMPTPATPAEESMILGLALGALRSLWGVRQRRKRNARLLSA